ncbi:MAG: hypothetical protein ACE5I4_07375 [Thermoplasmata archaeon]
MEGFHDAINVRLGRPLYKVASYNEFIAGGLRGRYHTTCLACLSLRGVLGAIQKVSRTNSPGRASTRVSSLAGGGPANGRPAGTALRQEEPAAGELGMTLNVLRLPPKVAGETPRGPASENPLTVLRQAMDRADLEQLRVLGEVREAFYFGVASPTVLPIDRQIAERLRTALGLSEEAVGILGPGTIRRREALYTVWIRLQLCG